MSTIIAYKTLMCFYLNMQHENCCWLKDVYFILRNKPKI